MCACIPLRVVKERGILPGSNVIPLWCAKAPLSTIYLFSTQQVIRISSSIEYAKSCKWQVKLKYNVGNNTKPSILIVIRYLRYSYSVVFYTRASKLSQGISEVIKQIAPTIIYYVTSKPRKRR